VFNDTEVEEKTAMANPFVHIELNTTDHQKAKDFYGKLLQWELKDMDMGPMGTYTTIGVGEGTGGGMMQHPMPGAPSLWIPYILVDDLAASTTKAKELGAQIIKANVPVSEMGMFSIITDPTGATFGLWENAKK
jgi:predicted enzyme related to lactoylglutathione lyase